MLQISDVHCPCRFRLDGWLSELGPAGAVGWVGAVHKPHRPASLQAGNRPEDRSTPASEPADRSRRAPDNEELDGGGLNGSTAWRPHEPERIPWMPAPTGARHPRLRDREAVNACALGALRNLSEGDGCL